MMHGQLDIKINMFEAVYENDQQDITVYYYLLFLGCSTCFERNFRSSSGASKLYYSFWYYTRMSLPIGILGVLELFQHSHDTSQQRHTCVIPEAVIQFGCSDDERKFCSKHVEQPRNNKLSFTVASCWSFCVMMHGNMNIK
jgi:hypothetical protein